TANAGICGHQSRVACSRVTSGATNLQATVTAKVRIPRKRRRPIRPQRKIAKPGGEPHRCRRSEEHTSELQSLAYLVCRLLFVPRSVHHPLLHSFPTGRSSDLDRECRDLRPPVTSGVLESHIGGDQSPGDGDGEGEDPQETP